MELNKVHPIAATAEPFGELPGKECLSGARGTIKDQLAPEENQFPHFVKELLGNQEFRVKPVLDRRYGRLTVNRRWRDGIRIPPCSHSRRIESFARLQLLAGKE